MLRTDASPAGIRGGLLLLAATLLGACGGGDGDSGPGGAGSAAASAQAVNAIAERYFARQLELDPLLAAELGIAGHEGEFGDYLSATWLADSLANEQDTAAALRAIDPEPLPADARITRAALLHRTVLAIEGYRYPSELLVLDPFEDLPGRFARRPRSEILPPLADTAAYDAYRLRLDGFVDWVDQAINNLRLGLAKEVVHPRAIVERTLSGLAGYADVEPTETTFWTPIREFPAAVPMAQRRRLAAELEQCLRERVLPAYQRLHDFLRDEYLPKAREGVAFSELPGGTAWYAYLARASTQATESPADLHESALAAVLEWRTQAPTTPGVLVPLAARPGGYLPDRASEAAWRAYLLAEAPAEGAPRGVAGTPPTQALQVAARAAVDTGVHSQGWSRQEAIDWLVTQLGLTPDAAAASVDRCIAQPARALAEFAGLGHFAELRRTAQRRGIADAEFTRRVAESLWMPLAELNQRVLVDPPVAAQ